MNNIEEIPLIKAFTTKDDQIVLIQESDLDTLLQQFGSIKNIPIHISISGKLLVPEPSYKTGKKLIVFKILKTITVDRLNYLKEKMVRCSDFSVYR